MIETVSIQIYTLRDIGDLERELAVAAQAGYRHVELVGAHLNDPRATRRALDAAGLRVSSAHVSLAALRDQFDAVIEACGLLDFTLLYMPAVPREERQSPPPFWRALGRELGGLADRAAARGIGFGYHNHDWDVRITDGTSTALDMVFEAAGASPLAWEVDPAWLVRGGADPAALMARYAGRINAVHVKDLAPAGQGLDEDGWADVGSGTLDWRNFWWTCRRSRARWMIVEHDRPRDPAGSIARSLAFIHGLPEAA